MSNSNLETTKKSRGRPKKDEGSDKLVLRIDLEKNLQDDFYKVKETQGLTNNTEVIRFCIREMASSTMYRIPETTHKIIEDIVQDSRIQDKYVLTSVDDFITRSIRQFIMRTRQDRSNLHDWDYRSSLHTNERDVANIIINLQASSSIGSTFEQIKNELPSLQEDELKSILGHFQTRHLLHQTAIEGQIYYYAIDRGYLTDEPISEF